jgi:hypothetical protein
MKTAGAQLKMKTLDKWANFDTVWCGIAGTQTEAFTVDGNDETIFNEEFVGKQVRCCSNKACK